MIGACTDGGDLSEPDWKDSVKQASRNLVAVIQSAPVPPSPPDSNTLDVLMQWMHPVSLNLFLKFFNYFCPYTHGKSMHNIPWLYIRVYKYKIITFVYGIDLYL